jgi:hypothetical protein
MGPLKNSRDFEIAKMPTAKVHPVCCFQPGSEPFAKKTQYMDLQHAICRSGKTFCQKKMGAIFGTRGVNVHFVSSEHHL